MKYCPICAKEFGDEVKNCPSDAAILLLSREWGPGQTISGRYRIVGKLGRGGMGVVYRAEHLTLEKPVALKVMSDEFAADPTFTQRFFQEARLADRLSNPHSVRIYDCGQAEDGKLYIAMEFVQGSSLRELLLRNPRLDVPRAMLIAQHVADALASAHALNIVHRDIKPENIMLTRDAQHHEHAKVMDFGIAAVTEQLNSSTLTRVGWMMGTPQYASPEQCSGMRGKDLDGRADLYALGVTLYEMLAGHLPFQARTARELENLHLTAPPPPFPPELGIPPALEALVQKLLAKKREDRPTTALAVIGELQAVETALSWGAPTVPSRLDAGSPAATPPRTPASSGAATPPKTTPPAKTPPTPSPDVTPPAQIGRVQEGATPQTETPPGEAAEEKTERKKERTRRKPEGGRRTPPQVPAQAELERGLKSLEAGEEEDAVGHFRKAAEAGSAAAQYQLGLSLHEGKGVEADDEEATQWILQAADQGLAEAQCWIGTKRMGEDSTEEAAGWFRKAAIQGHAQAQCELADCYWNGIGVEENSDKALEWIKKSAANNWEPARDKLYEYNRVLSPPPRPPRPSWWDNWKGGVYTFIIIVIGVAIMVWIQSLLDTGTPAPRAPAGQQQPAGQDSQKPVIVLPPRQSVPLPLNSGAAREAQARASSLGLVLTKTFVSDESAKNTLLGSHPLCLQWLAEWEDLRKYGRVEVVDLDGTLFLRGSQTTEKGKLTLDGMLSEVDRLAFVFNGVIDTQYNMMDKGSTNFSSSMRSCERKGVMNFRSTMGRQYWRLQQMQNPCGVETDYVDVFFKKIEGSSSSAY